MHFVLTGRILNISFPGTLYPVVCGLSATPVFLCSKGKVCPSMPFSGFDEGTSSFPPPALQCKLHAGSAFVMVSWHPVCTNRRERKERAFEENPLEQVTGIVRKMQAPVWKPGTMILNGGRSCCHPPHGSRASLLLQQPCSCRILCTKKATGCITCGFENCITQYVLLVCLEEVLGPLGFGAVGVLFDKLVHAGLGSSTLLHLAEADALLQVGCRSLV